MVLRKIENKSFIRSSEAGNVSYSYEDIASGLGYVSFYGMTSVSSTGSTNNDTFILSEKIRTSNLKLVIPGKKNGDTIIFNASPFNTPRTIKGNAFIEYSYGTETKYSTSLSEATLTFQVIKVSGVTETVLGTQTGFYFDKADTYSGVHTTQINLSQTSFKIGDYVRLKITITAGFSGTNYNYVFLGCDPEDLAASTPVDGLSCPHTRLKLDIPFKLSI